MRIKSVIEFMVIEFNNSITIKVQLFFRNVQLGSHKITTFFLEIMNLVS